MVIRPRASFHYAVTSYSQISLSLEASRCIVIMIVSLWNLTGITAALLSRRLLNFKRLEKSKPESRGFETSPDLVMGRPAALWTEALGPVALPFSLPAIQIRWKLGLAITPSLAIRSQQIFAHATTAQLSCHVQNFVAITVLESRWEWNKIFIEFELRWVNR